MRKSSIGLLSAAHLFDDVNQGVIPALLPFFIAERGLTIAAAGGVVLAANLASSILQPLFGQLTDRWSIPWLVPAGLLLAGLGVAASGPAPTYGLILCAAAASGIGVAAFHPEAARRIYVLSGERRATAMSLFAVGGNLGFAVGPALVTPIQIRFGLAGTVWLALPAVAMAAVLAVFLRDRGESPASARSVAIAVPDRWGSFARLTGAVIARAVIFYGLDTFIPLYWIGVFGRSKSAGAAALTLMLSAGVAGTLAGGWLADRFGRRVVVLGSMLALVPLLAAFVWVSNPSIALALLVPIGLALYAPFSVMTVLGQEYLPGRVGTASGVTIGLAVTLGGVAAPILGRIADLHGIHTAISLLIAVPVVGALAALTLPREPAMVRDTEAQR
jgi:FSR family fosmidomycin resistance protein-like MFS transporter